MASLQAVWLTLIVAGAGDTVLLKFSADWCAPCRRLAPQIVDACFAERTPEHRYRHQVFGTQ